MFHLELCESSERARRLNLTAGELEAEVLGPWGRGEPVRLGERAWYPGQAQITVIEGPEIPVGRLTMGRGWSIAMREGRDVTGEVLAPAGPAPSGERAAGVAPALRDAFGLQLLQRLGEGRITLHAAWRLARERNPQLAPALSLDLAVATVRFLASSGLVLLERAGGGQRGDELSGEQLDAAIDTVEGWSAENGPAALWLRRA